MILKNNSLDHRPQDPTPTPAFMVCLFVCFKKKTKQIPISDELVSCQTSRLDAWNTAHVDRWPFQIDIFPAADPYTDTKFKENEQEH